MACEYGERTRFGAKTRQRELNAILAPRQSAPDPTIKKYNISFPSLMHNHSSL